jgi:hypothetical protein
LRANRPDFIIPAQAGPFVIPAQAGIQKVASQPATRWIPACAGMTKCGGAGMTVWWRGNDGAFGAGMTKCAARE